MTNALRDHIADSIREIRRSQRLTQEELAERCDLSPSYISRLECKRQNVSINTLEKIADALGVNSTVLILESTHKNKINGGSIATDLLAILNSIGQEAAEMILDYAVLIKKRFIKDEKKKPRTRARRKPSKQRKR